MRDADVICAATTSSDPVFDGKLLRAGAHINAIGSYTPEVQEVDTETIARSVLFVDSREAALQEAGDLIVPIQAGVISDSHVQAEIGEVASGDHPGRTNDDQITLFKSVGVAVQDAAAAGLALRRAEEQDLGQIIQL